MADAVIRTGVGIRAELAPRSEQHPDEDAKTPSLRHYDVPMLRPFLRCVLAVLIPCWSAPAVLAQDIRRGTVSRLDDMSKLSDVKKALKRERDADDAESRMLGEIFDLEARLNDDERRDVALMTLRDRLGRLSRKAAADTDTPERSQARRVLRSITAGAAGRVQDREYSKLLEQYRLPGR